MHLVGGGGGGGGFPPPKTPKKNPVLSQSLEPLELAGPLLWKVYKWQIFRYHYLVTSTLSLQKDLLPSSTNNIKRQIIIVMLSSVASSFP